MHLACAILAGVVPTVRFDYVRSLAPIAAPATMASASVQLHSLEKAVSIIAAKQIALHPYVHIAV